MVVIDPGSISSNEDLARRVLRYARTIAPCLDSLTDGSEEQKDAIAILKGVAEGVRPRNVRSERSGSSAAEYVVDGSSFSAEDRASLRDLCGTTSSAGLPVGSFPRPSRAISRLWPEEC